MAHVYVVASGYSKRVVPARVPIELAISDNETLIATPTWPNAPPSRRVAFDAQVDSGGSSDRVADVTDGPARREWWLETSVYSVPLPRGWTAIVSGEVSPAFDLVRGESAIFVQTARNRPALDALAARGQAEAARGSDEYADWVELSYTHDGSLWIQRHSLLRNQPNTMVTGQGPADEFNTVREAAIGIVRRVVFT